MENFLSADKVKVILNNAPKGSDPGRVIQALVDKGYKLEGFNDKPEPLPKPSRYDVAMGKKNPDGTDNTDKGIIPQAVDQFKKGFKQTQEGVKNPNLIEGTVQIGKGILNEAAGGIRAVFSPIEAGMKIISKLPVIHQALGGVDKSVDYFADKISNNKKLQKFAMENPDADEVIANLVTIGLSVAAGKAGAPNGIPATRVGGIIDTVLKDVSTKSPEVLRTTIQKFKDNVAPVAEKVKEKITKTGESETDIAGKIFQAKPDQLDTMVRALENIDTKGIKSSEDLFSRLDAKAKSNTLAVDEALQKSTDLYKPSDITKTIEVKGGKPLKQDFVQTALDHLKELYEKTSDPTSQAKIIEKINKYQKEGLTAHEMNLIAREYGSEFGSKAFSKASGDPLTSVNAQSYENVRSGIKGTVREKMPDAGTKALDMNTSDSLDAMKLLKNVEIKAQQATNKLKKAGLIQKMGAVFGKGVDLATGGFVKGMLKTLFNKAGSGVDETLNAIQIKEGIPKLIKAFEKVEKIKDLKAAGVENQLKEIFKDFIPENKPVKINLKTTEGILEHIKKNDGITVNADGKMPTKGYVVSPSKATETKVPVAEFTQKSIDDFKTKFKYELSKPDAHFGVWKDGDNYVMDVSVVTGDVNKALRVALKGKQDAVWDLKKGESIPLKKVEMNKGNLKSAISNKKTTPIKKSDDSINKAIKEYGTTSIADEAGFITPDGKMIDSSGKKLASPSDRQYMKGRTVDHREIAQAALDGDFKPVEALSKFMNDSSSTRIGVVRDTINVDTIKPLTKQQMKVLEKISNGKTIYGDISKTNSLLANSGEFKTFAEYKKWHDKHFGLIKE